MRESKAEGIRMDAKGCGRLWRPVEAKFGLTGVGQPGGHFYSFLPVSHDIFRNFEAPQPVQGSTYTYPLAG